MARTMYLLALSVKIRVSSVAPFLWLRLRRAGCIRAHPWLLPLPCFVRFASFVVSTPWLSSDDGIVKHLLTSGADWSASSPQWWFSANFFGSGRQPLHRANALHNLHNVYT